MPGATGDPLGFNLPTTDSPATITVIVPGPPLPTTATVAVSTLNGTPVSSTLINTPDSSNPDQGTAVVGNPNSGAISTPGGGSPNNPAQSTPILSLPGTTVTIGTPGNNGAVPTDSSPSSPGIPPVSGRPGNNAGITITDDNGAPESTPVVDQPQPTTPVVPQSTIGNSDGTDSTTDSGPVVTGNPGNNGNIPDGPTTTGNNGGADSTSDSGPVVTGPGDNGNVPSGPSTTTATGEQTSVGGDSGNTSIATGNPGTLVGSTTDVTVPTGPTETSVNGGDAGTSTDATGETTIVGNPGSGGVITTDTGIDSFTSTILSGTVSVGPPIGTSTPSTSQAGTVTITSNGGTSTGVPCTSDSQCREVGLDVCVDLNGLNVALSGGIATGFCIGSSESSAVVLPTLTPTGGSPITLPVTQPTLDSTATSAVSSLTGIDGTTVSGSESTLIPGSGSSTLLTTTTLLPIATATPSGVPVTNTPCMSSEDCSILGLGLCLRLPGLLSTQAGVCLGGNLVSTPADDSRFTTGQATIPVPTTSGSLPIATVIPSGVPTTNTGCMSSEDCQSLGLGLCLRLPGLLSTEAGLCLGSPSSSVVFNTGFPTTSATLPIATSAPSGVPVTNQGCSNSEQCAGLGLGLCLRLPGLLETDDGVCLGGGSLASVDASASVTNLPSVDVTVVVPPGATLPTELPATFSVPVSTGPSVDMPGLPTELPITLSSAISTGPSVDAPGLPTELPITLPTAVSTGLPVVTSLPTGVPVTNTGCLNSYDCSSLGLGLCLRLPGLLDTDLGLCLGSSSLVTASIDLLPTGVTLPIATSVPTGVPISGTPCMSSKDCLSLGLGLCLRLPGILSTDAGLCLGSNPLASVSLSVTDLLNTGVSLGLPTGAPTLSLPDLGNPSLTLPDLSLPTLTGLPIATSLPSGLPVTNNGCLTSEQCAVLGLGLCLRLPGLLDTQDGLCLGSPSGIVSAGGSLSLLNLPTASLGLVLPIATAAPSGVPVSTQNCMTSSDCALLGLGLCLRLPDLLSSQAGVCLGSTANLASLSATLLPGSGLPTGVTTLPIATTLPSGTPLTDTGCMTSEDCKGLGLGLCLRLPGLLDTEDGVCLGGDSLASVGASLSLPIASLNIQTSIGTDGLATPVDLVTSVLGDIGSGLTIPTGNPATLPFANELTSIVGDVTSILGDGSPEATTIVNDVTSIVGDVTSVLGNGSPEVTAIISDVTSIVGDVTSILGNGFPEVTAIVSDVNSLPTGLPTALSSGKTCRTQDDCGALGVQICLRLPPLVSTDAGVCVDPSDPALAALSLTASLLPASVDLAATISNILQPTRVNVPGLASTAISDVVGAAETLVSGLTSALPQGSNGASQVNSVVTNVVNGVESVVTQVIGGAPIALPIFGNNGGLPASNNGGSPANPISSTFITPTPISPVPVPESVFPGQTTAPAAVPTLTPPAGGKQCTKNSDCSDANGLGICLNIGLYVGLAADVGLCAGVGLTPTGISVGLSDAIGLTLPTAFPTNADIDLTAVASAPIVTSLLGGVVPPVTSNLDAAATPVASIVDDILTPAGSLVNSIVTPVASIVQDVSDPVGTVVSDIAAPVGTVINNVVTPAASIVDNIVTPVASAVENIGTQAGSVINNIVTPVASLAEQVVTPAVSLIETLATPVASYVGDVVKPVTSVVGDIVSPVTSILGSVATPVLSAADPIVAPVTSLVGDVVTPVASVVQDVATPVATVVEAVAQPVSSVLGQAGNLVGAIVNPIVGNTPNTLVTQTRPAAAAQTEVPVSANPSSVPITSSSTGNKCSSDADCGANSRCAGLSLGALGVVLLQGTCT